MAKSAFDHCSGDYAAHRPSYPDAVVEAVCAAIGGAGGAWAADIGAGTGIFTRQLAERGIRVIAIEPSTSMLGQMDERLVSRVRRVAGTAERTALADASVDLVTFAQSFHWVNPPYALAEIGRILGQGGVLALVWNNRDMRVEFVRAFEQMIEKWNPAYRCEYRRQDWAGKVAATGLFTPLELTTYESNWRMPQEGFIGFTRSASYIRNVLSRDDRPRFEEEVRSLLREFFGANDCVVPLVSELWLCRRR